jgi:DNA polymerase-4
MTQCDDERIIFHVDLDAFYVEVERQNDVSLKGKPVIIGGLGPRGVVSTASYEARKFGIYSSQSMTLARRLCPQAIFMRGSHDLYRLISQKFTDILREFSPQVVPVSIDEAYMDMTGTDRLYGQPLEAAMAIRKKVRDDLGLPASIGIGPSNLVAKVSTEHAKPDGVFQVRQCEAAAFFAPQPVRNLPGIGPKASEILAKLRITTLGELAAAPIGPLRRALGPNQVDDIQCRAKGIDQTVLQERTKTKTISAETTFDSDIAGRHVLERTLKQLCERVGRRLRGSGQLAKGTNIKLRYGDFTTITRQLRFPTPSDTDELIYKSAVMLLISALGQRGDPIRLIGVGVNGLGEKAAQLSLLDENSVADSEITEVLDTIRDRFGTKSISYGSS